MSRCEWAACNQPGAEQVDGWWMCAPHVEEHHQFQQPERPYTPRPRVQPLRPCGTRASASRHRALGEAPCEPCRKAEAEYHRQAHLRRKAAAQQILEPVRLPPDTLLSGLDEHHETVQVRPHLSRDVAA